MSKDKATDRQLGKRKAENLPSLRYVVGHQLDSDPLSD